MFATPLSHWIGFHVGLLVLLAIELVYARRSSHSRHTKAIVETVLWVAAALTFALIILRSFGSASAIQYLAGYAIEEALSIDNLFVFLLLFKVFRIDDDRQPKVLFWGVSGAIIMRGAFIAAGLGLLARFHWISYVFAAILLFAAVRLLMPEKKEEKEATPRWIGWVAKLHPVSLRQDQFFVIENGQRMMTMLFLALIAIEVTDVVFALDSIPAVLSITRHPFIAYTSNIMAVMGLRSLYFLLAHLLTKLKFLHYGLAAVLAFAAIKMLATPWIEVGPLVSLGVIVVLLGLTVAISLALQRRGGKHSVNHGPYLSEFISSDTKRGMSSPVSLLKAARTIHLYLGVFITPALIFFAFTGFIQTFSLHETTRGSSYKPPAILVELGQLHKKQTLVVPVRRQPPPAAAPDAGKASTAANAPAAAKPADTPPAKVKNLLPMKLFFALVSIGLLMSTLTGLYMSFKYIRNTKLITAILLAGIVIPVLLTFL